jgi:hypothetical protein
MGLIFDKIMIPVRTHFKKFIIMASQKRKTIARNPKIASLSEDTELSTDSLLTTNHGVKINDDQNSLKAGNRGPSLLEDFILREKITHFDHERIPERVVHARGYGAHGFFETYKPIPELTKADLFQRAGEKTPAFGASPRWQATRVRSTWPETSAALR